MSWEVRYVKRLDFNEFMKRNVIAVDNKTCEKHGGKLYMLERGTEPFCIQCRKEKVEADDLERAKQADWIEKRKSTYDWLLQRSIIADSTIKRATFKTYERMDKETTENAEKAFQIAKRYLAGETFNTVFNGKQGAGKTHLSHAILDYINENSEEPKKCLFISVDELFRILKAGISSRDFHQSDFFWIDKTIAEADFLVLDDLGSEVGSIDSDKTASEYITTRLYAIANARQGKSTIITTNLSSENLVRIYDRRLVSRLLANSKGNIIVFKETTDKRMNNFGF